MQRKPYYTLGEIAREYGATVWQVRRLFERGILPPAERIGMYRVVRAEDLRKVVEGLRNAGYIAKEFGN
jgi:DNA-binding transcriptional MerR regulator